MQILDDAFLENFNTSSLAIFSSDVNVDAVLKGMLWSVLCVILSSISIHAHE